MIEMRVDVREQSGVVRAVKAVAERHRGGYPIRLLMETSVGLRRLTLGPDWDCDGSSACMAALAEFGAEPPRVVIA